MQENQIQAAIIRVSISNYVGTAALAVIAGAVALFSFIQQNYNPSLGFYGASVIGVGVLVVGIVLGGRGANATASELAAATWTTSAGANQFNLQAILTVVGLLLILGAAWLGTASPSHAASDPCVKLFSADLSASDPNIQQLRHDLATCQH